MKTSELYNTAICCVATRWINGEECMEDETAIAVLAELFAQRSTALWNEEYPAGMCRGSVTVTPYTGAVPDEKLLTAEAER